MESLLYRRHENKKKITKENVKQLTATARRKGEDRNKRAYLHAITLAAQDFYSGSPLCCPTS